MINKNYNSAASGKSSQNQSNNQDKSSDANRKTLKEIETINEGQLLQQDAMNRHKKLTSIDFSFDGNVPLPEQLSTGHNLK